MNRKIIFIGGTGSRTDFGGELTKNKFLIDTLKSKGYQVNAIDTYQSRRKFWKLFKLPFVLLFNLRVPIVISTSFGNIYRLIQILYWIKSRRVISYFCIGGILHERVIAGEFNAKFFKVISRIYVEGEKMKQGLKSCGIDSYVLPNFKRISYLPNLSECRVQTSKVNFVFLSRICKAKGVTLILETAKLLSNYSDRFSIVLYGQIEKDYEEEFNTLIVPLKNVQYKGKLDLSSNSGYDELASYDVMLFPTFWRGEGFPGALIDALIAGLPIIASDWNFNSDIVQTDINGLLVENQSMQALYEAMLFAIQHKEYFESMSETCQLIARKYDVNFVLNNSIINTLTLPIYG